MAPKTSLLILNGLADTMVSPARAAAYLDRLTKKGARPIVAVFPDGQHDLNAGGQAEAARSLAEAFLGHCLGGPSQPWANHLAGTRIELRAGEDQLPGLADALRAASRQTPSGLNSWLMSQTTRCCQRPRYYGGTDGSRSGGRRSERSEGPYRPPSSTCICIRVSALGLQ